jgi:hypothetical protein
MVRSVVRTGVLAVVVALAAAACSNPSKPSASPAPSQETGAPIPTATTIAQPVVYGYYDGHIDLMLSTDVSSKPQAKSQNINYSAALVTQLPSKYPALYMVSGPAAPNQPVVFSTEPGETDYTPLWNETTVRWNAGVTPVLLVKDDQVKALAAQGKLSIEPTNNILNCPIVKVTASHDVPTASAVTQPVVYGYYDGHVDTMLSTDVTSKAQAKSQHINYSAELATVAASKFPALYTVSGPAAPNQPVVFSTEPGETDYSPLWDEATVRWKAGVTPVLLVKDDQVKELASQGKLTIEPTDIILNCPIVKVS